MTLNAAIVGAGIIGMTTAIRLLEKEFSVTVYTKDAPLKTNSDAAVATWYVPDDSKPLLQKLCLESLFELEQLCKIPNSGVEKIRIIHYYKTEIDFKKSVWAKEDVMKLVNVSFELPSDYIKRNDFPFVFSVLVPLIDPNIYRPQQFEKFNQLGGILKIKSVEALDELTKEYDIVVNCAGWQAKQLADDPQVYPVRGQIEILKLISNIKNNSSFNVKEENSYVVFRPTSNDCVLGTTHQINEHNEEIRTIDKEEIIKKSLAFISKDEIVNTESRAGIRCGRYDVRLEEEPIILDNNKKTLLIHSYGHGGSGYSAAIGTANRVLKKCLEFAQ